MLRRLVYTVLFVMLVAGSLTIQRRMDKLGQQVCVVLDKVEKQIHYNSDRLDWQLSDLVSRVTPSVVYVEATMCNNYDDYEYDLKADWSGSGVIITPHIVLTAGHVIEDADEFKITTVDGNDYTAVMWVQHPDNDYGFLFFDEELGPVAEFADSNEIEIGDRVIIIGSPYGKRHFNTVTAGIVSGLNRDIPFFGEALVITTDAASNPDNSGGPVFDMQGRIIGILVGGIYGADGFGVLIPANVCKKFYEKVESERD